MVDYDIDDSDEEFDENYGEDFEGDRKGGGWLGIVIVLIILYLLFGKKIIKYEEMTAEEWFNEYDYCESEKESISDEYEDFRNCVEEHLSWGTYEDLEMIQECF